MFYDVIQSCKVICEHTNLNATQNGREFKTTASEIRELLGLNHMMSMCKLQNIKCYWDADSYICNNDIKNVMRRTRFPTILILRTIKD